METIPTTIKKVPCPCGCKNFIVDPFATTQCSSLSEELADALVAAWNGVDHAMIRHAIEKANIAKDHLETAIKLQSDTSIHCFTALANVEVILDILNGRI